MSNLTTFTRKSSFYISEFNMTPPGAWDKTHGRGYVYIYTVACEHDGEEVCMFKVGRSRDLYRRLVERWKSCPNHKHRLVSVVKVRYQAKTGEFNSFNSCINSCILTARTESWLHRGIKGHRFSTRCSDCGKNHREIFAIPGWRRNVVRDLEEAAKEISDKLIDIFGL